MDKETDGTGQTTQIEIITTNQPRQGAPGHHSSAPATSTEYTQINAAIAAGVANNVNDFIGLVHEANEANERERGMKLRDAFRIYPKAVCWSIILSSSIIMEGYDTAVTGSFNAYPSWLNKFGTRAKDGTLNIAPHWQNGIGAATNCGEIIGLQVAGFLSERTGYRITLIVALTFLIGFIFIPFFAPSLGVFLVGQFMQGISWGVFQTMTVAYAAEVCPVPLRHYLTGEFHALQNCLSC